MLNDVKLFTHENSVIFEKIKYELGKKEFLKIEDLNLDEKIIQKIFNFASIKYILDKDNLSEKNMMEIFNELIRDLKNYELEKRIEELESKFSRDFNENTFNELKELKKLQKVN